MRIYFSFICPNLLCHISSMFNNSKSSSHSSFRSQSLALAEVCIALVDIFSSYKLLEVREKERKIV